MLFSSLEFLFLFLPLCIGVYFSVPMPWRNAVLLIFSLIFYAFGEPLYLLLMIFTVLTDHLFASAIQRSKKHARKKRILIISIVFNVALLGFFKYYDFIAQDLSRISALSFIKPLGISLPVGISFYTFQSLSYVIDVYRGESRAALSPLIPATYVALFPQLIAGPIIKYNDIEGQFYERSHSAERAAQGIRRFAVGLSKKVILANTAGELWEEFATGFSPAFADTVGVWLGIIFYTAQIYFDFSGYSDMAIGLGKIFGFDFPENFNYPYISKSITEFWRRWHITLSSWFREYVYIPLGGNRRGRARMYLNLLIVWSLTGLWHGAGFNFLLWGIYYFLLLTAEKAFLLGLLNKAPNAIRHIYSIIFILIGWLIFASDASASSLTLREALSCLRIMFCIGSNPLISAETLYTLNRNLLLLLILLAASTPISKTLLTRASNRSFVTPILNIMTPALLILCTAYLVNSGYNPFLYFRF